MRKIIIFGTPKQIENVKKKINANYKLFQERNVKIIYKDSSSFFAELYGEDGGLKKTGDSPADIARFLEAIDLMPMGAQEKKERERGIEKFSSREEKLEKCGLPNTPQTSHCFADSTHHTCCLLGPKARKYADSSGNPIGITSENAFYYRYSKKATSADLTPWCTCTGSKVCSSYANRFSDGTKVKFIGDTNTLNEDEGIQKLKIERHSTPGV